MSHVTNVTVECRISSTYVEVGFSNTDFETFFVSHTLTGVNEVLDYLQNTHGLYANASQVHFIYG